MAAFGDWLKATCHIWSPGRSKSHCYKQVLSRPGRMFQASLAQLPASEQYLLPFRLCHHLCIPLSDSFITCFWVPAHVQLGPPVVPFYPFWGECSPIYPYSNLCTGGPSQDNSPWNQPVWTGHGVLHLALPRGAVANVSGLGVALVWESLLVMLSKSICQRERERDGSCGICVLVMACSLFPLRT